MYGLQLSLERILSGKQVLKIVQQHIKSDREMWQLEIIKTSLC